MAFATFATISVSFVNEHERAKTWGCSCTGKLWSSPALVLLSVTRQLTEMWIQVFGLEKYSLVLLYKRLMCTMGVSSKNAIFENSTGFEYYGQNKKMQQIGHEWFHLSYYRYVVSSSAENNCQGKGILKSLASRSGMVWPGLFGPKSPWCWTRQLAEHPLVHQARTHQPRTHVH